MKCSRVRQRVYASAQLTEYENGKILNCANLSIASTFCRSLLFRNHEHFDVGSHKSYCRHVVGGWYVLGLLAIAFIRTR